MTSNTTASDFGMTTDQIDFLRDRAISIATRELGRTPSPEECVSRIPAAFGSIIADFHEFAEGKTDRAIALEELALARFCEFVAANRASA